jgi:hypothetical protein
LFGVRYVVFADGVAAKRGFFDLFEKAGGQLPAANAKGITEHGEQ